MASLDSQTILSNTTGTLTPTLTVTPSLTAFTTTPEVLKRTHSTSDQYPAVLLAIYSGVLVSGTVGLVLMVHILQSSMRSVTTIAVLNLIFAHFLFLLTVPFRIYYYAAGDWRLGEGFCKTVSIMIHIHMYMSFLFYVIILVMRLLTFYRKAEQVEIYRKLRALGVSVVVWLLAVVLVPYVLHHRYGKMHESGDNQNSTLCFRFGKQVEEPGVKVFNEITSSVIIVVACVLTAFQANVLLVLYRKYGQGCTSQQVFWAQVKSLCFALVMVVCFVPYHMFRLHYVRNFNQDMQGVNEVFLSLTSLCCLDMLTFVGRGSCNMCRRGRAV